MMEYPKRPRAHDLESQSIRHFEATLPPNWTAQRNHHDYGEDVSVRIFENGNATNLEFRVQIKGSNTRPGEAYETMRLRVATYNYLWDLLPVVMLVKYVAAEDEAYWILLRDVPTPNQDNETFTVHIPRTNRLSDIGWNEIADLVREVTQRKLGAQRAYDQQRQRDHP